MLFGATAATAGWSPAPRRPRPLFERADGPVEYRPPDDLRPAQVGVLIDETADPLDVTASIVDLAVRGYLTIEEIPDKGLFSKADWKLTRRRGRCRRAAAL